MNETIAFVGVGRMGPNMPRRLKDKGYQVTSVFDSHTPLAVDLAAEIGAEAAQTLARVNELASVIITVVADDKAMRAIFAEQGDSLTVGAQGKFFINCATVSPQIHLDIEALAQRVGAQSLETCMASSITQAREGTLYLMTGGTDAALQRAEPILKDLSISLRHIGASGKAAQVKALVNMVMNINTAGLAWGSEPPSDMISQCCARFFPRPALTLKFSKPMERICKTATTRASSPAPTLRRTVASRFPSPMKMASISL
jgi:3-hydroxyisobutyrate dehydrogenase-like beta-hydroxyacid dehydrogenase